MDLGNNTILITGGATGIGFALARRFYAAGSHVILCGRRESALHAARQQLADTRPEGIRADGKLPTIQVHVCDLSRADERIRLRDWALRQNPSLNIVVNNAGIQHRLIPEQPDFWSRAEEEIAINFHAPVHLASLFQSHLQSAAQPALINITSGLSFSPLAAVPVYSATKAALHSFTLSLRHQWSGTPIRVLEILPPAVDTDLGGPGLHTFGVKLDEFADAVMPRLASDETEIAYGFAESARKASRAELDQTFQRMNASRP